MKRLIVTLSIFISMAATGCQGLTGNDSPIARENQEIIHQKNKSSAGLNVINPDKSYDELQSFGFVRHQKETALPHGETKPSIALYDPELLADAISKLSILIPGVHDVATLVTDRHVLVAYSANSENRNETADQVKRTAMSCVPRFFHVYVSDNPDMMEGIERFKNHSSRSDHVYDVLEHTIEEMLKSPQGTRISASENENGEYDGIDKFNDKHNYNEQKRLRN